MAELEPLFLVEIFPKVVLLQQDLYTKSAESVCV